MKAQTPAQRAADAIGQLARLGTKAQRAAMERFAIPSERAFGVPMNRIQALAKKLGRDPALADALWEDGHYEARILAAYVDEPASVTAAQMERWRRDFDNWAVVDTVCFALFDRTPHAWAKVAKWATLQDEWGKRAAFALLWGLTVHDKASGNAPFVKSLALIERGAEDERHFVKKAVNMALRAVGKRNRALNGAAIVLARRLGDSENPAARWVGRDALRELSSPAVARRLA